MYSISSAKLQRIRQKSWDITKSYGFTINTELPLIENSYTFKSLDDIINRVLILHVCCAHAYGFNNDLAVKWIESEGLQKHITKNESDYIFKKENNREYFKLSAESIWAFFWIINKISDLKFDSYCSDNLVQMLPDLKSSESSINFRKTINIKSEEQIIEMLDLVYCLHWSQIQFYLDNNTWKYPPKIIKERRKAFEWTVSEINWDDISLDT